MCLCCLLSSDYPSYLFIIWKLTKNNNAAVFVEAHIVCTEEKDDQPSKSQFDLMTPHTFSLNGHRHCQQFLKIRNTSWVSWVLARPPRCSSGEDMNISGAAVSLFSPSLFYYYPTYMNFSLSVACLTLKLPWGKFSSRQVFNSTILCFNEILKSPSFFFYFT